MSRNDIHNYFPFVLIIATSLALVFYPIQRARAILFFAFGYFLTTALYSMGYFADYDTRYHPLIISSFITILLYHSLDITVFLCAAWLIELALMVINIIMISSGISALAHWNLTVILNLTEFTLLLGNWWYGHNPVVYRKFFDLDIPLFLCSGRYCIVDKKGNAGTEKTAR